jgi:hypothetical protein
MGQEPWLRHVMVLVYDDKTPQIVESNKFLEHCRSKGIQSERPYVRMERILK